MECDGECRETGKCKGEVKQVLVSGILGFNHPYKFNYCETAIAVDEGMGFKVEAVDEHGLTATEYDHGITYPNG